MPSLCLSLRRIVCILTVVIAGLAPASLRASFTDVTVAAGVDYEQYVIPDPLVILGPEYMNGGAAAGDVDGDGWTDLFVTRYDAHDRLFRNKGDGTFEDVTASAGLDAWVLRSNGAGFADIDNDGDLDLYVTTHEDTRFYLFVNDGSGHFTEEGVARNAVCAGSDDHFGFSVAFGDYDRDGYLDIHVNEWRRETFNPTEAASNTRLLRNRGAEAPGHFEDVTVAAGVAMDGTPLLYGVEGVTTFASRFSDLDGDGWLDLAIAADFGSSRLFWNEGDGTFIDGTVAAGVGSDENGMGSAIGDWDGDGLLDWFVTAIYDPGDLCSCDNGLTGNRLYRNEGSRGFSDQTDAAGVRDGGWGWGAAFLDYDNDGDLDLTMNNGQYWPPPAVAGSAAFNDDAVRLWRNDGGTMTEVAAAEGLVASGSGKGVVVFDYDEDGDLDLFFTTNSGRPYLFRNDHGNTNDWLRVVADERTHNAFGVGVKVEVQATDGGPTQVREIQAGSHFLGQSETVAHFGIGPGPGGPVHEVRVTWAKNGATRSFHDVARNTLLVARKGAGCGLLGIEPLVALALGATLRRARRRGRAPRIRQA